MLNGIWRAALRRLNQQKGYTFLNIMGLALGMACTLLIVLWVMDELSYDRFHPGAERLYRIEMDDPYPQGDYHLVVTPYPLGPAALENLPEIEQQLRLAWIGGLLFQQGGQGFYEENGRAVDPTFFDVLGFPLQHGDAATALSSPDGLVLSAPLAEKYFGDADPVGETLMLNGNRTMRVTGVMAPQPENTEFFINYLLPLEFMRELGHNIDNWSNGNSITTLVRLRPGTDPLAVAPKIADLRQRDLLAIITDPEVREQFESHPAYRCVLLPVVDMHLRSYSGFQKGMGDIQYVYLFSAVAAIVLLIACVNFMNLSTARAAGRAREIGLRKTVGASRGMLILQFYGETELLTLFSLALALGIVLWLLPAFNQVAGKSLTMEQLFALPSLLAMLGVCMVTAVLAGSYPALYLSSMQPGQVLKGRLSRASSNTRLRQALVIGQFALSILLVVSSLVIQRQVAYAQERDLGYDRSRLIFMPMRGEIRAKYALLKSRLQGLPGVTGVSAGSNRPTVYYSNSNGAQWEGMDPNEDIQVTFNIVDYDYCKTLGISLVQGRPFFKDLASDTSNFLVNETLAKQMGQENVVGRRFSFLGLEGRVIGVMKDFHFKSAKDAMEPLAVALDVNWANFLYVRLAPGVGWQPLDDIAKVWQEVLPGYPFSHNVVEDDYQWLYRNEHRLGHLIRGFTVLALAIAALGLLGLAAFTAEQRTREIGIRKVLGAGVPGLVGLLSVQFLKWVLWANVLALPVAYWVLTRWLQSYADRIAVSWGVLLLAGGGSVVLALVTVAAQAVRASLADPVRSLKVE